MPNAAVLPDPGVPLAPFSARSQAGGVVRFALAAILVVTLLRIVGLAFNRTDLFVDEAQYWLWGRELAFGAYSKPPLIGWFIRGTTWLTGSEGTFQVRLVAPVLHAGAAFGIFYLGRMIADARTGALAALVYVTLPAVTLGSLLISTDTPMMFFIVMAMIAVRRAAALRISGEAAWGSAMALGGAVGLGLMSKYAMVYLVPCLALAGALCPGWRIRARDAGIAALVALAIIAPNVWWNVAHDFATVRHTADNADWTGIRFHVLKALEFFFSQAGVIGPFVFFGLLAGAVSARTPEQRALVALSVPILAVVTVQALMSHALANWAVGAYAAGVLLAVPVLAARRSLLVASLAINGLVAIALPLMTIAGTELRLPNGDLALKRYLGRAELARTAVETAQQSGASIVVAQDRSLLAALFYALRDDRTLVARALTDPKGDIPHHYALLYALQPDEVERAVYVGRVDNEPACLATQPPLKTWIAGPGFSEGVTFGAWRLTPKCREDLGRGA